MTEQENQRLRYCLYARKSTESDERQAMSIDSQIKEMMEQAVKENLNIVEVRQESHSAKLSGARPVFKQLISDIDRGLFDAILTCVKYPFFRVGILRDGFDNIYF